MSKIKGFIRRFLKPFWFSHSCDYIKVPYVYGNVLMLLFFAAVIIEMYMILSKEFTAVQLGAVAGLITTLAGLYFGTLKLYNAGIAAKNSTQEEEEPAEGGK